MPMMQLLALLGAGIVLFVLYKGIRATMDKEVSKEAQLPHGTVPVPWETLSLAVSYLAGTTFPRPELALLKELLENRDIFEK